MAPKSKKRLSKIGNKLLKLEELELKDVLCSICQSILVKPVTLPCFHGFCQSCFNGSVENNALCCPLCRLRIGSWLRTATKQKSLVNEVLWKFIQTKFSHEIGIKSKGVKDIDLPEEKPFLRLSAPGEIRREYETELRRLREERLQLEDKHIEETALLIKKIQEEEEEAHKKYLEALKKDEILAQQMQKLEKCSAPPPNTPRRLTLRSTKSRLKDTKIVGYLTKIKPTILPPAAIENSPLLTEDSTSTDCSTPSAPVHRQVNGSPEMIPSYGKIIKSIIEKKNKLLPGLWNKENGDRLKEKKDESKISSKKSMNTEDNKSKAKHKNGIPSLLVSLPLPCTGILQQKPNMLENRKGADSVDSMRQELCYFKPIDEVIATSKITKGLPLRVPGVRAAQRPVPPVEPPPSSAQYLNSLCHLRQISLTKHLPSAFVIALKVLRVHKKESPAKCETRVSSKVKKRKSTSPCVLPSVPARRNLNRNKQIVQINGITKLNNESNLRRTRSMGSITKDENETTPKKAKMKQRKAVSDNKPFLRSDCKKSTKKYFESPPLHSEMLNNNKVNLAVKNLSSPFKNCDVKHILHEQLRIEKIIEQEKIDFDLARKIEEEWNNRRPRRSAVKRQVTLNYALRPAKKLKV